METKECVKPNKEAMELDSVKVREYLLANDMPIMRTDYHPRAFVSVGRKFKKIPNVRYRIPRNAKKRLKSNLCKHGWDIKKLKFSYRRLNQDVGFILKENSEEIRKKILDAGIDVCLCAEFTDADWLEYHTSIANSVHGNGYPYEGMTKEETRALFLHEVQNPVYCKDVNEFIMLIKEFEATKE